MFRKKQREGLIRCIAGQKGAKSMWRGVNGMKGCKGFKCDRGKAKMLLLGCCGNLANTVGCVKGHECC